MPRPRPLRLQIDPTRTMTLRRRYEQALVARFLELARVIKITIADNDALGLGKSSISQSGKLTAHEKETLLSGSRRPRLTPMGPGAFRFNTSPQKVAAFLEWLAEQTDKGILQVYKREGQRVVGHAAWQNLYVQSAYQRGIQQARAELIGAGKIAPLTIEQAAFPFGGAGTFNAPIHADRLGLIYTRNFEELQGINAATSQKIARTFTQGVADGISPRVLARRLVQDVDGVGIQRARMLARTEIIRSHAEAKLNTYESAGEVNVTILAEVLTAGDGKVCPQCNGWQRRTSEKPIPISQARNLIPFHPNCRCTFIGAGVGENRQKRIDRAKRAALLVKERKRPTAKAA